MKTSFAALATLAVLTATTAFAQSLPQPVKARQGQFNILAQNLGILGGMARGTVEYDAETAQGAADSLVAVASLDQHSLWPEGTDAQTLTGTRAKAEIWANMDDFAAKWGALGDAAAGMQTAAAEGQAAIGPAMGALGGACSNCHDTYRAPQ